MSPLSSYSYDDTDDLHVPTEPIIQPTTTKAQCPGRGPVDVVLPATPPPALPGLPKPVEGADHSNHRNFLFLDTFQFYIFTFYVTFVNQNVYFSSYKNC